MKETRISISVWNKDTKWGDTVYFCCDAQQWQRTCALTTNADIFPWWKGELIIHTDPAKNTIPLEYKFLVWRDNTYAIWETFTSATLNRKRTLETNKDVNNEMIVNKFGEREWWCPLCSTTVTDEVPVVCPRLTLNHPMHIECFELYICDELEHNKTSVCCMKCLEPLPNEAWQSLVKPTIVRRYDRVVAQNKGATVLRCPMSCCDYEKIYNADGGCAEVVPDVLTCEWCDADWCTKCDRLVEGECKVCELGLTEVASQVLDALEDVAGVRCPTCQQRGQKLPCECTHITCDCGTVFCYCCGMAGSDVDSSDMYASSDLDRLYGHNDDYSTNDQRCPMWLVNFADLYGDWPDDVEAAQKKFHKMKAGKKLKEVQLKIDPCAWENFMQIDESIKTIVEKYMSKNYVS